MIKNATIPGYFTLHLKAVPVVVATNCRVLVECGGNSTTVYRDPYNRVVEIFMFTFHTCKENWLQWFSFQRGLAVVFIIQVMYIN